MKRYFSLAWIAILTLAGYSMIYWFQNPNLENKGVEAIMDFTKADNITGFPHPIIPNIVHIVHFGSPELNFGEMITIKSVHANHKPDRILIHCNCHEMSGKYWNYVSDIPGLEVVFKEQPTQIFGRNISWVQHASDVARLEVLMEYGGIYLDRDVYVVSSFEKYRHFELVIGWDLHQYIGNQVILAHKDARFLKLYYETYRHYNSSLWYYNGGQLPTTSILYEKPYLVHRVIRDFGVDTIFFDMLYREKTEEWRTLKCVHLLLRHRRYLDDPVKELDEINIKTYNKTFGDMARLVLYGSTELILK